MQKLCQNMFEYINDTRNNKSKYKAVRSLRDDSVLNSPFI